MTLSIDKIERVFYLRAQGGKRMAKKDINFGVGFTVDKSGLDQIKKSF